jgi:hypothetical protein
MKALPPTSVEQVPAGCQEDGKVVSVLIGGLRVIVMHGVVLQLLSKTRVLIW